MVILGFVGWKRALRKILGSHYAFEVSWFNIIASLEGYREDWIFYLLYHMFYALIELDTSPVNVVTWPNKIP